MTKKTKIAVVHYLPLEYYPPSINLLKFLSNKSNVECTIFSTVNKKNRKEYKSNNLKIFRFPSAEKVENSLGRIILYYIFNIITLIRITFIKPTWVIYFDSYSALPVYWYRKWLDHKCKIWMHSYEYFSKEWYERGMKTVKFYHKKEINYLYRVANVLSQTNQQRMDLFQADYPFLNLNALHILPNYPPKSWYTKYISEISIPVRFVYVGSLSLKNTYIRELIEWTKLLEGKATLDIYAYNTDKETHLFLQENNSNDIHYFDKGIEYEDLPGILRNYHVGLILYKDFSRNFIYNETNKLFEYLSANLDVWFSDNMQGLNQHVTYQTYPQVIKTDFKNLTQLNIHQVTRRDGLEYKPFRFYCETVYNELLNKIEARL